MLGIILDVIIVAIILLNTYMCYRKGLVKLAVGLIAVIAAFILSVMLYRPITALIMENTELDETIESKIVETFGSEDLENVEIKETGFLSYFENEINKSVTETKNQIVGDTSKVITEKLINVIAFVGIFIVARIALLLLTLIADLITSLPILKQFNEAGGFLYGIIKSLLIIYIALAILSLVISLTNNVAISEAIDSSYLAKFFYEHNLVLNILL